MPVTLPAPCVDDSAGSRRRRCDDRDVDLSHLGTPIGPMRRVEGKASNRVYRLDTEQGAFAVKERTPDRGSELRCDDVFRFEQAAFAAGIPMPEPVAADAELVVHRWVDGEAVPEEPVPHAFAFEIGEILA